MKIILCGYQWVGCEALSMLINGGHEVFVFTHEPQNGCPDVIGLCEKNRIPYSTDKISSNNLPFKPDAICSIYYRYIIDKKIIDICDRKIFNLHPSLLPKYRGCSSIPWAMINAETETGYTYHYIDEKVDTGNVITQESIKIYPWDTQLTLYYRVMFEAMKSFDKALKFVLAGKKGTPQKGTPSYYKRGCPFNAEIDPAWDADKIERFIRAMIFPPFKPASIFGKETLTMDEYNRITRERRNDK